MCDFATISSISTHEYVVDGGTLVTEMNVSTTGSLLARFYYLEILPPDTTSSFAKNIYKTVERKTKEITDKIDPQKYLKSVIKNYPETTHAKTVEYRLPEKEMIGDLYKSVHGAWRNNKKKTARISM